MEVADGSIKKCSFCGEDIAVNSSRCPFCGSLLEVKIEVSQLEIDNVYQCQTRDITSETNENSALCQNNIPPSNCECVKKQDINIPVLNNVGNNTGCNGQHAHYNHVSGRVLPQPPIVPNRYGGIGNGLKVFITIICTVIPGLGQLAGIIVGIVLMNSDDKQFGADKKSFGLALLIASIVMFVISCISCFVLALAFSTPFE